MAKPFRIALVTCRHLWSYAYEEASDNLGHYENLAIGYLAAALEREGFPVTIFNETLEGLSRAELMEELREGNFQLVGFSTGSTNALPTLETAQALPRGVHRCLGGYAPTFFAPKLLAHGGFDSLIRGEGELPFVELAQALSQGKPWENIANLCTRATHNPLRPLADLDSLPFPSRRELALLHDRGESAGPYIQRVALVSGSRGCSANCTFCYATKFYRLASGPPRRYRDPVQLVDELEELVRGPLQIDVIWFVDEDFIGAHKRRIRSFISEMRRRKLVVPFEFDCRTDEVEEPLFRELKQVGLRRVFLGVESFAQPALDRIQKGLDRDTNFRAIEILDRLGIRYRLGMIFFDWETSLEELRENVEVCHRLGFDRVNDPGRAMKKFSLEGTRWNIPRDSRVRRIFERLHAEMERIFGDSPPSYGTFMENKRKAGDFFYDLVREES